MNLEKNDVVLIIGRNELLGIKKLFIRKVTGIERWGFNDQNIDLIDQRIGRWTTHFDNKKFNTVIKLTKQQQYFWERYLYYEDMWSYKD